MKEPNTQHLEQELGVRHELFRHRILDAAGKLRHVYRRMGYRDYRTMRLKIAIIAGLVLAIIALSVYASCLSRRLDSARRATAEQTERAAAAERRAEELQRAADALREAQTHADRTRQEITQTHADVLWRIDDIIDSGALDERVCELARAAYDSLVCAADGDAVPAASATSTP